MNYDLDYYDRLLRQNSTTAAEINHIRWEWVREVLNGGPVLDYGSGVGWFRAFAPEGLVVDTLDLGIYPQTGIRHEQYDVIAFWDVLEHIPQLRSIENVLDRTNHVAITVPVLPEGKPMLEWKHYKPDEHCRIWTLDQWTFWFGLSGFRIIKKEQPECPPREDIWSVLYSTEDGKTESRAPSCDS
jgi:hypothetical protein